MGLRLIVVDMRIEEWGRGCRNYEIARCWRCRWDKVRSLRLVSESGDSVLGLSVGDVENRRRCE